jgi:hypothetical protein
MCAQRAIGQLNDHHGGSEISEPRSCLPGLQNLEAAPLKFQSQIAGTWHGQLDQMSAVHARTIESEKCILHLDYFSSTMKYIKIREAATRNTHNIILQ